MTDTNHQNTSESSTPESRQRVTDGLAVGSGITVAVMSLFQDVLGQERYIDLIRHQWVTGYFSVPIALLLLVGSIWRLARLYR